MWSLSKRMYVLLLEQENNPSHCSAFKHQASARERCIRRHYVSCHVIRGHPVLRKDGTLQWRRALMHSSETHTLRLGWLPGRMPSDAVQFWISLFRNDPRGSTATVDAILGYIWRTFTIFSWALTSELSTWTHSSLIFLLFSMGGREESFRRDGTEKLWVLCTNLSWYQTDVSGHVKRLRLYKTGLRGGGIHWLLLWCGRTRRLIVRMSPSPRGSEVRPDRMTSLEYLSFFFPQITLLVHHGHGRVKHHIAGASRPQLRQTSPLCQWGHPNASTYSCQRAQTNLPRLSSTLRLQNPHALSATLNSTVERMHD